MKINSRKLLVYCYLTSGSNCTYEKLGYLWPEISLGGRRGMIAYLQKQRLISVSYTGKQAIISLSRIGRSWVENNYPILSEEGNGNTFPVSADLSPHEAPLTTEYPGVFVLVSPKAPLNTKQLAALKKFLKSELVQLSTNVCFSAKPLSADYLAQLSTKYYHSVSVVEAKNWLQGDTLQILRDYDAVSANSFSSSSISKELNELTEKNITFFVSNHQSKLRLFSFFDRIFDFVESAASIEGQNVLENLSSNKLVSRLSKVFS